MSSPGETPSTKQLRYNPYDMSLRSSLLLLLTVGLFVVSYFAHRQSSQYEAERVVKQGEISQLKQQLAEKSQALLSQEQAHSLHKAELKKLQLEHNDLRRDCFSERTDPQGNVRWCTCTCQESHSSSKLF